jgi:hypothetical protein
LCIISNRKKNVKTLGQLAVKIKKEKKNMVLGSGIRKKPIPDPGSRGQKAPNPGSRIRIRNTACCHRGLAFSFWANLKKIEKKGSYGISTKL